MAQSVEHENNGTRWQGQQPRQHHMGTSATILPYHFHSCLGTYTSWHELLPLHSMRIYNVIMLLSITPATRMYMYMAWQYTPLVCTANVQNVQGIHCDLCQQMTHSNEKQNKRTERSQNRIRIKTESEWESDQNQNCTDRNLDRRKSKQTNVSLSRRTE